MKPPFIIIRLCDNDFGQQLEQVAKLVHEAFFDQDIIISEEFVRLIVIDLVVALCCLSEAAKGGSLMPLNPVRAYLTARLRVEFADHAPTEDHDGGSVAIDRNTNYIWRF